MQPLIALGVLLLLAIGFGLKLLWDLAAGLRRLGSHLPTTEDLAALRQAIAAQQEATRRLPDELAKRVAAEVGSGIKPLEAAFSRLAETNHAALGQLSGRLEASHERLGQVLAGLDRAGGLGEWVTSFRDCAEPFQLAAQSLETHYETSGRLLSTTGELVTQLAGHREAVEHAFLTFSEAVTRSQAAETTHLRDIEHRVMNRLEEVAEIQNLVAQALSELQTASRRTQEAHESLAETVRATVEKVNELLDAGRQTQSQHHELIRAQEGLQKRFATWHSGLEECIQRFQQNLEQLPVRVGQALQQATQQALAAIETLGHKLERFHEQHARALDAVAQRQAAVSEDQARLLERQERLLAETKRQAALAPIRTLQAAAVGLLVLQAILLGVLALGSLG
jgi:hypothetical protein